MVRYPTVARRWVPDLAGFVEVGYYELATDHLELTDVETIYRWDALRVGSA